VTENSNGGYTPDVDAAFDYARDYYKGSPKVIEDFEMLARYRPEVFAGYINFRQQVFNTGEGAALDRRTKELIIVAIEIARTKTNPAPVGHARWAIEAGATPAEIAEVASICIMIGGMLTFQESGRHALRAAEEHYEKLQAEQGEKAE
jgi:alkylhydroperoxidase/carboxymuconolactone decarboxylase family protein YurZ